MSFASLAFFLFLPVVFGMHWLGRGRRWQNGVLLVASYVFYGWWDWRFCGLVLAVSLVDLAVGQALGRATAPGRRRVLLGVSVATNLGALGFFKYFNFFADSLAVALAAVGIEASTTSLNVVLPIGISFYTLQTLTYTIDIYRGRFTPRGGGLEYLVFVVFFPQLVAGPIERAERLLPQFCRPRVFDRAMSVAGCRLMLWGFVKKLLLADNLGVVADAAFARVTTASAPELAAGVVAFAFQIYGDFSGYSDIAAGVGRLFGIELSRNFALPYFAPGISEFWRRWHVTLSSWLRDYVFIPLGGSRGSPAATVRSLGLTMLVSGLWHGAAWHFVAWGAWHGLGLALERTWRMRQGGRGTGVGTGGVPGGSGLGRGVRVVATFVFVCLGWVWFRAGDLGEATEALGRLTLGWVGPAAWTELPAVLRSALPWGAGVAGVLAVEWWGRHRWDPIPWERMPGWLRWGGYTVFFWALLLGGTRRPAEFIYFQF